MSVYSRNCVVAARLEDGLTGGSGLVVTVGANSGGALPVGNATVTTPGTGYPPSRTIEVYFQVGAGVNATGRIVTNGSGAVTSATIDDGGSGYANATSTTATVVATPNGSYGQYTAPSPSTNAILVGSDFKLDPQVVSVERDVMTGGMGGKQTVPGEFYVNVSFTVELAGSGAAITEPAWAVLLKAAGAAGALTAATKWDYTPISDQFPSMSLRVWRGQYRHTIRGARVSKIDFDFSISTLPTATITIIGIEVDRVVQVNAPNPTFSAWKTPQVITDANTADIRFGSAYNAATGAITGGTAFGSKGLKLTWDNSAKFRPFLGGSSVPITQRELTGALSLDLGGADNVAFYNAWKANALSSLSFSIGSTAGSILKLFAQGVERNNPGDEDDDGLLLQSYSIRCRQSAPSVNDEIRIITM